MGSMTGRAAGYCAGYPTPGFANPVGGRLGRGMAWGRGRGFGRSMAWARGMGYPWPAPYAAPFYGPPTVAPEQELDFLQNQAKALQDQLTDIQKRISELESGVQKEAK